MTRPDGIELFGSLPVLKLGIIIQCNELNSLPSYLGSTFRGLIGSSLQSLICPFWPKPTCKKCTISLQCPYFELFEKQSSLSGLKTVPRGYIFFPQKINGKISLEITLFGSATRFVPALLKALFKSQEYGLGAKRIPFNVVYVGEILTNNGLNPLDQNLDYLSLMGPFPLYLWLKNTPLIREKEILFPTPVRLRKHGDYLRSMDWPFFFLTLARRLESLNIFFNGASSIGKDIWQRLKQEFADIEIKEEEFRWYNLKRYSNRQKRKVPLGGLKGKVVVQNISSWWWTWWQMAEIVHVGKGANMGLGKVKIL